MARTMHVGLVACGRAKGGQRAPARELYRSGLFRAASRYAEEAYDRWYVISAAHGLVEPGQVLAPYELALTELRIREREAWAARVASSFQQRLRAQGVSVPSVARPKPWPHDPEVEVWLHAGKAYAEPLLWPLSLWPCTVHTPMAGLRIGEQLAWYAQRRRPEPATAPLGGPPEGDQ